MQQYSPLLFPKHLFVIQYRICSMLLSQHTEWSQKYCSFFFFKRCINYCFRWVVGWNGPCPKFAVIHKKTRLQTVERKSLPNKEALWPKRTHCNAMQRKDMRRHYWVIAIIEQGHGGRFCGRVGLKHKHYWKVRDTGVTLTGTPWLRTPKLNLLRRAITREYITFNGNSE